MSNPFLRAKLMCDRCFKLKSPSDNMKLVLGKVEGIEFQRYFTICPKCGGNMVEVDDIMIASIQSLNRKGYITEFCCGGHSIGGDIGPYICFHRSIRLKSAPEGFVLEPATDYMFGRECIRFTLKRYPKVGLLNVQRQILNANLALLDWVEGLPEYVGQVD